MLGLQAHGSRRDCCYGPRSQARQIVKGRLFSEPMRVETGTQNRGWDVAAPRSAFNRRGSGVSRFRVRTFALVLPHPQPPEA